MVTNNWINQKVQGQKLPSYFIIFLCKQLVMAYFLI